MSTTKTASLTLTGEILDLARAVAAFGVYTNACDLTDDASNRDMHSIYGDYRSLDRSTWLYNNLGGPIGGHKACEITAEEADLLRANAVEALDTAGDRLADPQEIQDRCWGAEGIARTRAYVADVQRVIDYLDALA